MLPPGGCAREGAGTWGAGLKPPRQPEFRANPRPAPRPLSALLGAPEASLTQLAVHTPPSLRWVPGAWTPGGRPLQAAMLGAPQLAAELRAAASPPRSRNEGSVGGARLAEGGGPAWLTLETLFLCTLCKLWLCALESPMPAVGVARGGRGPCCRGFRAVVPAPGPPQATVPTRVTRPVAGATAPQAFELC